MSLSCALQQIQILAALLCLSTLHDAFWLVLPSLIHRPVVVISAANLQGVLHSISSIARLECQQYMQRGSALAQIIRPGHKCCVALSCNVALPVTKPQTSIVHRGLLSASPLRPGKQRRQGVETCKLRPLLQSLPTEETATMDRQPCLKLK